jgi:UrcA family protein
MAIQSTGAASRRPQIPLIVLLCSFVGVVASGAAGAAVSDDFVPHVTVKFSPAMLATEDGARAVYRRIVKAADRACPDTTTGSRILNESVRQCRQQAVARAVQQVNNAELAQIYSSSTKHS